MLVPSYILIGLPKYTEILIIYMLVMEYYLIMNRKEEEEHLSLKKLPKL